MPLQSKAQSRLMHGVASGSIKGSGVPKKVARDFVASGAGKSQAKLPERKEPPSRDRGMVSERTEPAMSDVIAPRKGAY